MHVEQDHRSQIFYFLYWFFKTVSYSLGCPGSHCNLRHDPLALTSQVGLQIQATQFVPCCSARQADSAPGFWLGADRCHQPLNHFFNNCKNNFCCSQHNFESIKLITSPRKLAPCFACKGQCSPRERYSNIACPGINIYHVGDRNSLSTVCLPYQAFTWGRVCSPLPVPVSLAQHLGQLFIWQSVLSLSPLLGRGKGCYTNKITWCLHTDFCREKARCLLEIVMKEKVAVVTGI